MTSPRPDLVEFFRKSPLAGTALEIGTIVTVYHTSRIRRYWRDA